MQLVANNTRRGVGRYVMRDDEGKLHGFVVHKPARPSSVVQLHTHMVWNKGTVVPRQEASPLKLGAAITFSVGVVDSKEWVRS